MSRLPLGDEDGRVGQEHELAQEVRGAERAGRAVTQAIAAQCDECLDVGDPGRSDPVLHAPGCSLVVGGADIDLRSSRPWPTRPPGSPTARERRA